VTRSRTPLPLPPGNTHRRRRFGSGLVSLSTLSTLPLLLISSVLPAQPTALPDASEIDWVPLEQLTPAQQQEVAENCCGRYIQPAFPVVPGDAGTTLLQGDRISVGEDGIVRIDGGLQALQEGLLMRAAAGSYNRSTAVFTLEDSILIRQQGLLLTGSRATVDRISASSALEDASYLLHETGARGNADLIVYTDADGVITIDNGVFTRCEPGDDSWVVAGDNIQLDRDAGRGFARNVTLRVRDVPVLYLPWVSFPIDDARATGFLAPVIGSTRDGGLDLALPYYLNLAPNYDLTLTPRLQFNRGLLLGSEFRHRGNSYGQILDLQYMPDDRLFDPARSNLPASRRPPQAQRWLLNYDFIANPAPGWSAVIDYAAVSDRSYFQDLGNNGLIQTTLSYLYRDARVQYQSEHWTFNGAVQGFQILDPAVTPQATPYRSLPRLNLAGSNQTAFGLDYGVDSELVYFERDVDSRRLAPEALADGVFVTGSRLSMTPYLSLPWASAGAFVTPTLKYKYANWHLQDQAVGAPSNPSRGVVTGTLDSGLIFERALALGGSNHMQTLEPRLFYLYSEYEDQRRLPVFDSTEMTFGYSQLFRDDRFSGKDRVGDADQLTLALTSRIYDQTGREKAHLSLGQIRHFEDRRVSLFTLPASSLQQASSALVGEGGWQLNDNWRASSYLQWNPDNTALEVGNFQFQYQSDINHIINIGFRYRDDTGHLASPGFDRKISQTDLSAVWPVNDEWGVIGRFNYDHANKRNLETIAGLEYSNCCWNLRVIARKWIDNNALFFGSLDEDNSGIFVQFELKGLGSVLGGNVTGILNNGINGYREREYVQ